jgi:WD40 repeat protein
VGHGQRPAAPDPPGAHGRGFLGGSEDGTHVLTGDRTAVLWDAANGEKLQTFRGHTGAVWCAALSADGRRVLTGSHDRTAVLWDAAGGERLQPFRGHTDAVWSAALSRDGKRVLTGSWDKTAILWDAANGEKLQTFQGSTGAVSSVALSGDGKRVLLGCSGDQTATLWDAAGGQRLQPFRGHTSRVLALALSGDGKRLLTGSADRTAVLWDMAGGEKLRAFQGHTDRVGSVALSGDGQRVLTGSSDRTAVLWDAAGGQKLQTFQGHTGSVSSMALSGDGQRVLTGNRDKVAVLWDAASGKKLQTFQGHTDQVVGVALVNDGRRVLTGSGDYTAILWDAAGGQKLQTFEGGSNPVYYVALGGDGKHVLTGSVAGPVLWDAASGQKVLTFRAQEPQQSPKQSPKDDLLGEHQRFMDLEKQLGSRQPFQDRPAVGGQKLQTSRGHTGQVRSVALSGDGRRVLTGSDDRTAILWDAAGGQNLRTLRGHTDWVESVALSADAKRAFTGSGDGTTRLWDADSGAELCRLVSIDGGADWLVITPEGLFDGSANGHKLVSYRLAGTNTFVPLESYQKRYFYPGLLAALIRGERPRPKVDVAHALPPTVRLTAPARSGTEVTAAKLTVQAEAESVGEHPVREVRLLLDGRPFQGDNGIRRLSSPKPGSVLVSWDVELSPGRHTLKVLADTAYSQGASAEAEVRYAGGDAEVELPRLYVLAFGVAKYQDERLLLNYPARDAEAVADAFRTHSKPLFRSVEVKLLTDGEATRAGILKGLRWLRQEVTQKDVGVVYFSGHGDRDTDGNLYFLPADADAGDVASTSVPAEQVKKMLLALPGRVVLILDACHAGGVDRPKKSARDLTDNLVRDLAAEESGLVVLCSSTGREFSLESNEYRHGFFTLALVEGLSGKAAKSDGAVYLHHLDAYITDRVKELTKGHQHPVTAKPTSVRSFPLARP